MEDAKKVKGMLPGLRRCGGSVVPKCATSVPNLVVLKRQRSRHTHAMRPGEVVAYPREEGHPGSAPCLREALDPGRS